VKSRFLGLRTTLVWCQCTSPRVPVEFLENRKKSKLCCISISQWYSPCPNVESGHAGNISCVIGCAYCSDEFDKVPNAFEPEHRLPITAPTHSAR
jgi:hypothetical protein